MTRSIPVAPSDQLPDDYVSAIDRTDRLVLDAIARGWTRKRLEGCWSRGRVARAIAMCGGSRTTARDLAQAWDDAAARPVRELSPLRPAGCRLLEAPR